MPPSPQRMDHCQQLPLMSPVIAFSRVHLPRPICHWMLTIIMFLTQYSPYCEITRITCHNVLLVHIRKLEYRGTEQSLLQGIEGLPLP